MKKKYWGMLIALVFIAMIIIPVVIHVKSPNIVSEITADGLLDYLGNCVVAVPTIVIAVIAIWQTNKANKLAEEANKSASESEKIAEKSNEIAERAICLTEQANIYTTNANKIAEKANDISQKLLELEELRQTLELRPSFAITSWCAPIKDFNDICVHPECLSVEIGTYSYGIAWGIELEILNTSSGFECIGFDKAISKDGKLLWTNTMTGMTTRKIELQPLEKKKIYFYADKEFWEKQIGIMYDIDFYLNNRLDKSYKEKFELMIVSMDEKVPHNENEVYLHLEIQNYSVGKITDKYDDYPEGVIWEN